jgi:hypothetical protein
MEQKTLGITPVFWKDKEEEETRYVIPMEPG